uniref:Uncharacterized protein n=1 Tax=Anguilla anguilla TaxID=7936 RepID=A0A0E9V522_ANGAN
MFYFPSLLVQVNTHLICP